MTNDIDLTPRQRRERGVELRKATPRSSHADWSPAPDRPNPVMLLEAQNEQRLPWLVPYRYQRMGESPFAFFRGSAKIMAADLAQTPTTGIQAQICGDAHLANFGLYASPERNLVFDINDFDETHLGPWEWDVKRLAASFTIASRHNGFDDDSTVDAVQIAVRSYRDVMQKLADMPAIQVWYAHVRAEDIGPFIAQEQRLSEVERKAMIKRQSKLFAKARTRNSNQALDSLTTHVDGEYRIKSDPPFVVEITELAKELEPEEIRERVMQSFALYRESLPDARRHLLDRYRFIDLALKVVGVGSVGTRCFVALFKGHDAQDPLILQVKEAGNSVVEEYLGASPYQHHGQRVVEGQRLMQTVSDVFLGWSSDLTGHDYYWRQLRDMKLSAPIENYEPLHMRSYAGLCGLTLAHAHARTGDAAAIAGYLGSGESFVRALTEFAERYADQNEQDYNEFIATTKESATSFDEAIMIAR